MSCGQSSDRVLDQLRLELQSRRLFMEIPAGVSIHLHHHPIRPGPLATRVPTVRLTSSFLVLEN